MATDPNEEFADELDRKLKAMSGKAKKRRLAEINKHQWVTLADTVEMVMLTANLPARRAMAEVKRLAVSGKVPVTGVIRNGN